MRGFDVAKNGLNRNMRLNGAVCAHWTYYTVLAGYGGSAYRVICMR